MGFHTFTAGEVLTAANVNTYLMNQAVIVCTSGTRPSSPNAGMVIFETDTNYIQIYSGSAWVPGPSVGAWTSYTPSLTNAVLGSGGSITGAYKQIGKSVLCRVYAAFGTSGNSVTGTITVSPPLNINANGMIGSAMFYDNSAGTLYAGIADATSATTFRFWSHGGAGTVNATIPFTWSTSDSFQCVLTYETP